jgi:myo-inositol 2-dehydrogenase / D-chiro-inositol 1-dehydrogenase
MSSNNSGNGDKKGHNRREFLSTIALGAVGTVGVAGLLSNCSSQGLLQEMDEQGPPPLNDQAPDGEPLKAGLVGCGGRGTGAALNFVDAGPNLEVIALADVFEDQMIDAGKTSNRPVVLRSRMIMFLADWTGTRNCSRPTLMLY